MSAPLVVRLVCLGNICRSPMAAVVLEEYVDRAGLSDVVAVSSAGTGGWHIGQPMDSRAAATLTRHGFDPTRHRAQQVSDGWSDLDLVLAMDEDNLHELETLGYRPVLFRDFDPEGTGPVPDPYFGGDDGFERVFTMVDRTARALVEHLRNR